MNKPKILSVTIEHKTDVDADTSCLGDYTDDAQDYAIIREGEHSGMFYQDLPEDVELPTRGFTYRFFLPPVDNYKGESEADIRKSCLQDYERMESLNRGDWQFIGIIAKADVVLAGNVVQHITSGGLWGIESDGGNYLEEVNSQELDNLSEQLGALGFSRRAIERAFQRNTFVQK
jgi:hypothetical protein